MKEFQFNVICTNEKETESVLDCNKILPEIFIYKEAYDYLYNSCFAQAVFEDFEEFQYEDGTDVDAFSDYCYKYGRFIIITFYVDQENKINKWEWTCHKKHEIPKNGIYIDFEGFTKIIEKINNNDEIYREVIPYKLNMNDFLKENNRVILPFINITNYDNFIQFGDNNYIKKSLIDSIIIDENNFTVKIHLSNNKVIEISILDIVLDVPYDYDEEDVYDYFIEECPKYMEKL